MQQITLKVKGDAAWPELDPAKNPELKIVELQSEHLHVAFLDNGTVSGQPVVLFRSDEDGKAYVIQVTANQFHALAHAFFDKYGHSYEGDDVLEIQGEEVEADGYKQFRLPDNIENFDQLTDAAGTLHEKMMEMLNDMGVGEDDLEDASANISNSMKWFADNYSRLLIEGKVPKGQEYRSNG